jgi:hypothetical protein
MASKSTSFRVRATVRVAFALVPLVAPSANAQTADAADPLHPSLRACAALNDDVERLACYDRAVELLASGKSVDARRSPEDVFGIDPQLSRETSPAVAVKREDLPEITAGILEVESATGGFLVKLDNGQTWMLMDEKRALVLHPGDSVKIVRAALGTFRLVAPDNRAAKVRRVR